MHVLLSFGVVGGEDRGWGRSHVQSYSHTSYLILSYLILLSYLIEDTGRVRAPMVIWASVINDRDDLPGGHNRVGFVKNCSLMKQFFSCAAPHPSPTLFAVLASF